MKQLQNIFGTCGANAEVNVVDRQGEILASTKADASGNWCIETEVTIGASVRADVKNESGRNVTSDWIEISEQVAAAEPEETAEEREHREQQAAEMAVVRGRLERYYVDLVCAMCDGRDVDFEYVADLLAALDKSMIDFEHDVTELQRVSTLNPPRHILAHFQD